MGINCEPCIAWGASGSKSQLAPHRTHAHGMLNRPEWPPCLRTHTKATASAASRTAAKVAAAEAAASEGSMSRWGPVPSPRVGSCTVTSGAYATSLEVTSSSEMSSSSTTISGRTPSSGSKGPGDRMSTLVKGSVATGAGVIPASSAGAAAGYAATAPAKTKANKALITIAIVCVQSLHGRDM